MERGPLHSDAHTRRQGSRDAALLLICPMFPAILPTSSYRSRSSSSSVQAATCAVRQKKGEALASSLQKVMGGERRKKKEELSSGCSFLHLQCSKSNHGWLPPTFTAAAITTRRRQEGKRGPAAADTNREGSIERLGGQTSGRYEEEEEYEEYEKGGLS